ncbi:glycine cleavage system protein GcvH [Trichlorobacter ammonificans]|uniref:Glycine cleavage system H protein n=1 Tax=Trichlorobacter ammonificans TaxID=2916410 RepID=A0ABM9DAG3_9BACT|nr:glycine cleavage system protein GcvH [Trichlorobacter ammonificans]CAH2032147.1 glycine cleavage system H protein [Trichlorobacter ammonificans]
MSALYFTKEHEWALIEGNVARIGISEHAARELGDVTFVELPAVGKAVKQSEVLAAIESVKAASDIYAPVSGTVRAVNTALEQAPEQVNESAEAAAWMVELELSDPADVGRLMTREQYAEYLATL